MAAVFLPLHTSDWGEVDDGGGEEAGGAEELLAGTLDDGGGGDDGDGLQVGPSGGRAARDLPTAVVILGCLVRGAAAVESGGEAAVVVRDCERVVVRDCKRVGLRRWSRRSLRGLRAPREQRQRARMLE